MHIHRVIGKDGQQVNIGHAHATALVSIGVLVEDHIDNIAVGYVVHYYRKAD